MQIKLPSWKPEYKLQMTEQVYNQFLPAAQTLLDRALLIYQGYLKTGDPVLYEVFDEVMVELKPKCQILKWAAWLELKEVANSLETAADALAGEDGYQATMLLDLAGCIRG